jgi:UDP-3-O-[3-hydroxymyristoyl] glucosamine N-acyltransferase
MNGPARGGERRIMHEKRFRWENCRGVPDDARVGKGCDLAQSVTWGRNVTLGNRVRVGPNTVLLDNVTIEDECVIGPNCVIGEPSMGFYREPEEWEGRPTRIGRQSVIRAGSILSENVQIGEGFQTGPYVSIREDTVIGKFCSIGNYSDIQPDIHIGDYSRLHSNVHLTEGARVGKYVWIMPGCTFTNDNLFPVFTHPQPPEIGDYSVLGASSFYYPGVRLGRHVVVAAGSRVRGTHGDFDFISGDPAKKVCDARKFFVQIEGKFHFPYPWPKHITKNYPWKDVAPEERRLEEYCG